FEVFRMSWQDVCQADPGDGVLYHHRASSGETHRTSLVRKPPGMAAGAEGSL
ncbi:hypothetical protein P7K49_023151, partial [Saguinus oedipus]